MAICNVFSCEYPCCLGQLRFIVSALCFFTILVAYCQRVVLNIAITEMVTVRKNASASTCPKPEGQGDSIIRNIGGGKIDWGEHEQSLIISSFFIGYVLLHVPAGLIADKYGARHVLIAGMALSTTTTFLLPWCAVSLAWYWTFILRIITGAGQGAVFPAVSSLVSRWIPPFERGTVGAAIFAANSYGLIVGNSATGVLIQFMENWPYAYYLWGMVGVVFCMIMLCYLFSDPRTDPFLTQIEMEYLTDTMVFKQPMTPPFLSIFTDWCMWGLISAQCGHSFIIFSLANNMPKYFNNVLGFNIRNNGLISFIYVLLWISSVIAGIISDYMVKKKNANVSFVRKSYTVISNISAGVFLVLAGYANCNYKMALVWFGSAIFFKGIFFAGLKVSIIDVSLNHSGMVMSIINGIGAITGFICSSVIGKLAPQNTLKQWHTVYWGLFGIQILTTLFYVFTASSNRREWDYLEGEELPVKQKTKWYLELSPSAHELRLEKDAALAEKRKAAAVAAKQRMKDEMRNRR